MEAQRTYILIGLAIVTYLLFIAWQEDYAPRAPVQQTPTVNTDIVQDVPTTVPSDNTIPDQADLMPSMPSVQPEAKATSTLITVETDVLRLMIDPRGGDVVSGELLQFPLTQENPDIPVHILKQANGRVYTAMSGLIGEGMPDSASPRALYTAAQTTFKLADGVDELIVPLRWTNPDGLLIEKIYSLSRSSYEMDVSYRFTNTTTTTQTGTFFGQLKRDRVVEQINTGGGIGIQAYLGAAYSTQEKRYERYDFDDMDDANLNVSTQGGWVAFLQHYFISAWVPNQELTNQISTVTPNNLAIIRVVTPTVSAAPGEVFETGGVLYLGPKIQDELEKIATGLDLTVDYGFLWWIGQPLFWILSWIQTIVGNWGLAIIGVTLVIKLILYPLSAAQYRSFAKMRHIQPKVEALKNRYGEDRQKMSQAMMELYRKEKVNPLGGCLPLLVQMPVFIALYWVLLESVELRHAEFYLWIKDLSAMDPLYILPLLMGASMWLMQKMQPMSATMDPMQQKIMQFMPVIMTVFFLFFPAGLVLYWLVNNLLSIAQQLYVTKKMEKELAARPSNKAPK
jgi:YidC/Oxa1 family membrane protein insertase